MHRFRIIYHRRNPGSLEGGLYGVPLCAVGETDGVLGPAGAESLRDDRGGQPLQPLRIMCSDLIHGVQLVIGESLELYLQNRSLKRVQPGIQADADIVILELSLPVHAIRLDERGPLVIVGEYRTPVAVAPQRLRREERGRGNVAETARTLRVDSASEPLRTILEDQQPVTVGHGADSLIVSRKAEKVHGDDDARPEPSFRKDRLHGPLQISRIDVEGFLANVHENRRRSFQGNDLRTREKGKVRHEHGIAGADSPGLEGQGEGVRTVGAGQAMLHAHIGGQLTFQGPHLRSHDIGSGRHRFQHNPVDVLTEDLVLMLEISEFHRK